MLCSLTELSLPKKFALSGWVAGPPHQRQRQMEEEDLVLALEVLKPDFGGHGFSLKFWPWVSGFGGHGY